MPLCEEELNVWVRLRSELRVADPDLKITTTWRSRSHRTGFSRAGAGDKVHEGRLKSVHTKGTRKAKRTGKERPG